MKNYHHVSRFLISRGSHDIYNAMVVWAMQIFPTNTRVKHISEGYTSNKSVNKCIEFLSGQPAGHGVYLRDFLKVLALRELARALSTQSDVNLNVIDKLQKDDCNIYKGL